MGTNTVRYRPLLTHAARPSTFDVAAVDENGVARDVAVAGEHPLTLYVDKRELLTLMTLGAAPEALAIGYLRNQRLVERLDDIVAVQVDWETNSVVVKTRHGLADLDAKTAKRTTTSGCGQGTVFGDLMEDIDNVRLTGDATLTQAALYALLDKGSPAETIYKQAGAVHGCALATHGDARADILIRRGRPAATIPSARSRARMWLDRRQCGRDLLPRPGRLPSGDGDQGGADGHSFLVSRSG
jgi:FdhD protein